MLQTKISKNGSLVIPVEIRQKLEINVGDAVLCELYDGEARITTRTQRIRRAQALVRKHVPAGQPLADELIAERRAANSAV